MIKKDEENNRDKNRALGFSLEKDLIKIFAKMLENKGIKILSIEKTPKHIDRNDKIDYIIKLDPSKTFEGMTEIKIDVKLARSFTLFNLKGENIIENSLSDIIAINLPKEKDGIREISENWIIFRTKEIFQLFKIKEPNRKKSSDGSVYFFIDDYREETDPHGKILKYYYFPVEYTDIDIRF